MTCVYITIDTEYSSGLYTGPGLADRILASAPSRGGKSKGEGSVLGGIGRILDGDGI